MKTMRYRCLLLLLSVLTGCGPTKPADGQPAAAPDDRMEPELEKFTNEVFNPSIVQILANRNRFHGRKVQVQGFLHVRFEDTAIYLSKDDADHGLTHNGFWVTFDGEASAREASKALDGKYVLIEGTFDKDHQGHLSLWQGTIQKVVRVYEMNRRD